MQCQASSSKLTRLCNQNCSAASPPHTPLLFHPGIPDHTTHGTAWLWRYGPLWACSTVWDDMGIRRQGLLLGVHGAGVHRDSRSWGLGGGQGWQKQSCLSTGNKETLLSVPGGEGGSKGEDAFEKEVGLNFFLLGNMASGSTSCSFPARSLMGPRNQRIQP